MPDELRTLPSMPEEIRFVFEAFIELSLGRPYVEGTPLPIPNREIMSWCWLNNTRLKGWELSIIRILDSKWRKVMIDQMAPEKPAEPT